MEIYKVDFKYKNKAELLELLLYMYSRTSLRINLSKKRLSILREYIINGYSPQTKRGILIDLKMTRENLNTQNCYLQKVGLLKPHPSNQQNKLVNPALIDLYKVFIENEGRSCYLVNFIKNEE